MIKTTNEIRRSFIEFFRSRDHQPLPSGPLVPANDPTLMFANAGMVQFKDVFTGARQRPAPAAATAQKCIRISGKHNDLENVGRTSRHHTFFEMLGNFSFGDYFKREACRFAWDFLVGELRLDVGKLWVTVFAGDDQLPGDDEAFGIWQDEIGVSADRILRGEAKDNFWSMGDVGPCGPCSEVLYDRGEAFGEAHMDNGERFFELWNLVFMQYQVSEPGGAMSPLPAPSIDTGAGLERIASVLQGVESNYDVDVFAPLVAKAAELSGKTYGADPADDVSLRVIADHARMTAFLVSEGVFPEKTGREYVLRRVMRRAIRHGHRLGIGDLFLHRVADKVIDGMHGDYPELEEHRALVEKVCRQEEERFRDTLGHGLALLGENADWEEDGSGGRVLPGELAFDLTATYGFPVDLIQVIGEEEGFTIDEAGYAAARERHRAVSGAGKIGEVAVASVYSELHSSLGDTRFTGYDHESGEAQVLAVIREGNTVEAGAAGQEIELALDETPFYGESGGQVGDTGEIVGREGRVRVTDTVRPLPGLWVHRGVVEEGSLRAGDQIEARVDGARRSAIRRHHTATHLLHMALRKVLGKHAVQKGSRVSPELLRFDFAHFEAPTREQLAEVEDLVYREVLADHEVQTRVTSYDEARASGATALFEENYGDVVRLVTAAPDSQELCGGNHVGRTGEIGSFLIVGEGGIAAGVRRVEALAGLAAQAWVREQRGTLEQAAGLLKAMPTDIAGKIEKAVARERELAREVDSLKRKLAGGGRDLLDAAREVDGVKVLGVRLDVGDPGTMRDTADTLRDRIGSGVICLGAENKGKAALLVAVTADLVDRFPANKLIREVAAHVGGKGGGRPDMSQAGGPDVGALDKAVESIYETILESGDVKEE